MKKYPVKAISAVFAVIMLFSGCSPKENAAPDIADPPFFKVEDKQTGGTAYLLGTMHTAPDNCALPEKVYSALDECGRLAVEVDLTELEKDSKRLDEAMRILELRDGTARDVLGDDYGEIRNYFEKKKLYAPVFERYIPSVWGSLLTNSLADELGYDSNNGTDRMLLNYAKENSINVIELESVESQYEMNSREPMALQIYFLKQSVQTDREQQKDALVRLYEAWKTGDLTALEKMLYEDEVPAELKEEYDLYLSEMYENRQRAMSEKIINSLKNGEKLFVAVGAMHFAAPPDILDFLGEAGYEIQNEGGTSAPFL